jgi:heavy metal sensor kinase
MWKGNMLLSIKSRIILFYAVVIFILLSFLSIFLYTGLKKIVFASIDLKLLSQAHSLEIIIDEYNDEIKNEEEFKSLLSNKVLREYNFPESDDCFFQMRYLTGKTIKKSISLENQDLPFSFSGKTHFKTEFFNGRLIRQVDLYIPEKKEKDKLEKAMIVQYAMVIEKDFKILREFKIILIISILFILISSAFGANVVAKKALVPVDEISETIAMVSEANLSERINVKKIPMELKDIASSFNHTIGLLEKSFIRQKEFIADASHELRTPLATIISQSEITLRKERTAWEYKESLSAIMNAAGLMSNIVQKLLLLTRLTADRVEFNFATVHIEAVLTEAVTLLKPLAEGKEIQINISVIDTCEINGDRNMLLELFLNIISNGITYNKTGGEIYVSIRRDSPWVITEIKDTGIGIPEEDLDKVFNRFYRVDKSRSRESGGIGLGLSIAKDIVRLHNGKIVLKSQPGNGTCVEVYLKI